MTYPISLEGFEDQTIEIEAPGLFSTPRLLVNGKPAPKGPGHSQMLLRRSDGSELIAAWKPQMLGFDVPQLAVDGKTIAVVRRLTWYEWGWCLLTAMLLLGYGPIGAGLAILVFFYDFKIFRSALQPALKYLAIAGLSGAVIGAYILLSITANSLLAGH